MDALLTVVALLLPALMGSAFGIGWTPCIGPILAGILALAATQRPAGLATDFIDRVARLSLVERWI